MKISNISESYSNKPYQGKVKTKILIPKYSPVQNTISSVYPKNYYLSFKGEEKCDEIKAFERIIDEFYAENKGKPAGKIEIPTYYDIEGSTISEFINSYFIANLSRLIKNIPKAYIDEKTLANILDKSLKQTKERIQRIKSPDLKPEKLDISAQEIIEELKKNKEIQEITHSPIKSGEVIDFNNAIYRYLRKIDLGCKDSPKLITLYFGNYYSNNLKEHNIPLIDKELYDKMKEFLANDEKLKAFNQKMLKINAQNALHSSPSLQETAESIYNDIIERHINPFDNPKTYDYVSKHDESLDFLLEKNYGNGKYEYDEMFEKSGIDKKHKVLLIDPGLAARFEEFTEFIEKEKINTTEIGPYELRKKFSDYLGSETVYRGVYFDDPQEGIKELKNNGALASVFKNKEKTLKAIKYYIAAGVNGYTPTIAGKMSDKIKSPQNGNDFLSVTSIYAIAASVPKKFGDSKCPVVVIKTEVPKLSVIKQKNRFANIQNGPARVLIIDDERYPYRTMQDRIEAFVPFYMSTDNAEFITDTTTGVFHWGGY